MLDLFMDILSKQKKTTAEKLVVDFDLEYTTVPKGEDQTVAVSQLCVENHVLVYHYHFAQPSPSARFAAFINIDEYQFATIDASNDRKML